MTLEFRIYKLKEDGINWKNIKDYDNNNQFLVVGEENIRNSIEIYKAIQVTKGGELKLLPNHKLDEFVFLFEKEDLIQTDYFVAFDLPKEILTLKIIENIKKFNKAGMIKIEDVLLEEIKQIKIR